MQHVSISVIQLEFDVFVIRLHGFRTDPEFFRDPVGAKACAAHGKDMKLAIGQVRGAMVRCRNGAAPCASPVISASVAISATTQASSRASKKASGRKDFLDGVQIQSRVRVSYFGLHPAHYPRGGLSPCTKQQYPH